MTARSRALDWTRRTVTRRRYQTAAATITSVAVPDVDESLMWQTEAKAVREAVQALPEPLRNAIRLAFYHQRTYRDVARDLAIPEGTAKSRLRRGLATLADRLAAEGIIDKVAVGTEGWVCRAGAAITPGRQEDVHPPHL